MSLRNRQAGFTVVEFMIATTVFSVILLVVTGAILYMNRSYQRSMYTSRTQQAASNLVDTVATAVKFSAKGVTSGAEPSGTLSYCLGNRQILYVIGKQLGDTDGETSTTRAVVSRQSEDCLTHAITSPGLAGHPKELLGKGMRLGKLVVDPARSPYVTVTARVIYGDDDLLCSDNVAGSCDANSTAKLDAGQLKDDKMQLRCREGIGSEYCAVSELSTTVFRRL